MHLTPRPQRPRRRAAVAALLAACPVSAAAPAFAARTQGLDLSSWQGNISQATWNNIKNVQGKQFGFVRASRGATFGPVVPAGENDGDPYNRYDDPQFVNNITRGTAAGMLMGSYHFNRAEVAGNTGVDEANHYMETGSEQPAGLSPQYAGNFMRPGYLLPVFDLERGNGLSQAGLTTWANDFINRIFEVKGFYPIVYTSSSYNNDEVAASVAWHNVDTGVGPHTNIKTYQWLARPSGDIVNGEPVGSTSAPGYPNPYGVWDANYNTRTNSRDPAINPWSFWQNGTFTISGGVNGSADQTAANGNLEYVKDFLVPALWTNNGSGDWATVANWNSNNPLRDANPANVAMGPTSRLPNSIDWVQLRNTGGGTITLSTGTHTVRKLTTEQPFSMTGGSLTVAYVPGSGGRDDVPAEFAGPVTIANSASYSAHTTQVDNDGGLFNINGGTVTFHTIDLVSDSTTPGKIVMGGNATFVSHGGVSAGTAVIRSTGNAAQPGSVDLGVVSRTITVSPGPAAVDLSIQAPITGTGGLVKGGAGTMQLTATNTYSGGTTVNNGILRVTRDLNLGAAPASPQVSNIVLSGGTLQTGAEITGVTLNTPGSGYTSFPTLTINGGGGDVVPASANVLAGISSIAVTAGGSNYINQSVAPAANTAGTFVDVVGGGGTGATAFATVAGGVVTGITIINPGTGYTSMPTIHISSTLSAGLAAGSGAAANVGGITLQGITLNDAGFDYAAPTISLTGGGGSGATASATSNPNLTLASNRGIQLVSPGGTLYQTAGTTLTHGGAISGTGALTKSGPGTLKLTGTNNYTGGTTVAAGTLIGSSASLPGNITNNAALVFEQAGANGTLAGTISGGGTFSKTGGGTLTLSAANTYSGPMTVSGGKLVAGNADAFGTGSLTLSNAAAEAQAGLPKALSVSSISVVGTGNLNLTNNDMVVKNSNLAAVQNLITLGFNNGGWNGPGVNSSSAAASPNSVTALGYGSNAELSLGTFSGVTLDGNDIVVKYTYYGDADLTGVVDLDDFGLFLTGYQNGGLPRTWIYGDFDYTGVIDLDDFGLFLYGYQNQGGPLSALSEAIADASGISSDDRASMQAAISAVPEPTSAAIIGLTAAALALSRRRGRRVRPGN